MDTYVIRRPAVWAPPPAELEAAVAEAAPVGGDELSADIRWIRSYVVAESDGRLGTFGVYEASSPEKIREHAAQAGIPASEIHAVVDTIVVGPDPATIGK